MQKAYVIADGQDPLFTLNSELARAERSNEELAVVVLRLRRSNGLGGVRRRINEKVTDSIRMSDTACWYDSRHVALILPDTTMDGARRVLHRIQRNASRKALSPQTRIFQFPQTQDVLGIIDDFTRV